LKKFWVSNFFGNLL